MNISLVRRRFNLVILILFYVLTATSDLNPTLAGKKVTALGAEATTVSAGSSVEMSVTINKPAPSKGGVVYLSSSDPSLATVPDSVTVPPGQTSALFVVDTASSPNSSSMVVSASYGARTKKLTVVINGVTPPSVGLSGFILLPSGVPGGTSVQGILTLSAAAPAGGAAVALTNSNPSVVNMPASVMVAAGASQASFTIATSPVSTITTVSLSAVYAGVKKAALLDLTAGVATTLTSVSLIPTNIAGGSSLQGTVTMSAPAGFAGAVVPLSSSNSTIASVPASVTVSASSTSAIFTVATGTVSTSTTVLISASYGGVTQTAQLIVNPVPATLSSLSLNPASVAGGSASQGTVTLVTAAPSTGAVVSLSSNNAAANVPASVTVSAGATSATFPVTTTGVSATISVTITASSGVVTRTSALTVNPAPVVLSSISVNPTTVAGGTASQATVTLSAPAPSGGAVVSLSSNNTAAATVPASVSLAPGVSSGNFTVFTSAVLSTTSVNISASYGGGSASAILTVNSTIISSRYLEAESGIIVSPMLKRNDTLASGGQYVSTSTGNSGTATYNVSVTTSGTYYVWARVLCVTSAQDSVFISIDGAPEQIFDAAEGTWSPNWQWSQIRTRGSGGVPGEIRFSFTETNLSGGSHTLVLRGRDANTGVDRLFLTNDSNALPADSAVPPSLVSLTLNPAIVVGGQSSLGTVTLDSPALSGGAVVSLASGGAAATVPTSVTIPAGASTATFTVNTGAVSSATLITISGAYGGVTRTASLTLNPVPAALTSIALNPASVVGGNPSQGTVTLTGAAPSGGAVVSLSSNNAAATVLTSVTVAAGSSTATFTVNTSVVSSSTPVTISGVYSGVTRTASLTVNSVPAALSSIALNPTTVVGGNSSQGTVTLTAAAPTGGAVVSLSSNNAAATVLTSVTVAAGSSTATFTVNTSAVSSSTPVTISGVYSGVTRTASLTVNVVPAALSSIALNPSTVVGGNSSQGTVTLTAAAPTGGAVVSLSSNNAAATVLTSVTVAAGSSTATFTVNTSSVSSSTPATISGVYSGVTRTASLTVNPVAAALSSIALNPTAVVGGNTSQGTVTLTAAAPTGGAVVSLSSNNAAATVLTSVTVSAGSSTATFTVNTSAVSSSTPVTISGVYSGVTRTASLTVNAVPAALSSIALNPTTVVGGNTSQGTVTLTAAAPTGGAVVSLSSNNAAATVLTSVTVSAGSSTATFTVNTSAVSSSTPVTISGLYIGVTRTASLTVNPVPAALSSIALNPTSVVGGNPSQGTVTLTVAAPTGGAIVSLSSNNAAATVLTSVTVSAGSSTATFTVNTSAVSVSTPVTISGVYSGVTRTASLTVTPVPVTVVLSSLSLNPLTIVGGTSSQGTVTLTGAAPVGGAVVSLSSTSPLIASTPPSVTVPPGSTSATFTINSVLVVSPLLVTISASYGGVTRGVGLSLATSLAPTFYAAPNGSPSGNGSISQPWDLQTALNQPLGVVPGATIYLRGGTYRGKFSSQLAGLLGNVITVRSFPGEWAKIEGYVTSTLRVALPSAAGDPVTVVLNTDPGFKSGTVVRIGNEDLTLSGKQADGLTWTNCARGWNGTTPVAHSVGDLVVAIGDQLTINGQYAYYQDFEVFNSDPLRSFNARVVPQEFRGEGIVVNPSTGIKLINLVLHDNREGIFAGVGALGLEVYGCIIFNNGIVDWDRGHGQGIYLLNGPGAPQKKIRNVISFNGFSDGMKAYSESQYAQNFLFEHVISFNNGVLASFPGNFGDNGSPLSSSHRYSNLFVGTGNSNNPTNDIRINDSYFYHSFDAKPENGNIGLGYQAPGATGLEITNSRIMGGNSALALSHFRTFTVTGNKLYAQTSTAGSGWNTLVNAQLESGYSGTWNNNTYFDQLPIAWQFTFMSGTTIKHACDTGAILKFTEPGCAPNGGWKENTGFDANSSYTRGLPTGTEVFVIPNEYESGRAHIAIYNWALTSTVSVNLSNVLVVGDPYSIYSAEDFLGSPVKTGVYDGNPVAVPMTGTIVRAPIGLGWTPQAVRPQFGAFVVRKQ